MVNESGNPELERNKIERLRLWVDFGKWFVSGLVLIVGFLIIRPHEQDRLDKALELDVFKSYLSATNTENIEDWQRKLNLMKVMAGENDRKMKDFIVNEQDRINVIREEKNKVLEARQQKAQAEKDTEATKKKYTEIKIRYDNLAEERSQEKKKLEEEKKELENRIAKFESLKQQAGKQEKESVEKLTSYGVSNATVNLSGTAMHVTGGIGGVVSVGPANENIKRAPETSSH